RERRAVVASRRLLTALMCLSICAACSHSLFSFTTRPQPRFALFPYTTLFRSLFVKVGLKEVHEVFGDFLDEEQGIGFRSALSGRSEETRLNSSHVAISYAVFCLKKKTTSTAAAATTVVA